MSYKNKAERMQQLCYEHQEYVETLENKTAILMRDKTEAYTFLTDDGVYYLVHLTYVYSCNQRHDIESMVEGRNYHVTGLYWIQNKINPPIEITDYEELVDRCNEFMKERFDIDDCYTEYDFGYEDEEIDSVLEEEVWDDKEGHCL
tara:strand:+ start:2023 stop:2460 length:438 start_codon:yes stop_codon:yes gene_type:complete